MSVPLFDLSRLIEEHRDSLICAFEKCIDHSRFIMGPEVGVFEDSFSKKVGSKYCISSSSGTDALLSIFMALDLKPGSEILVPSFTFIASASSIIRAGLKPVFVDLAPNSFHPSQDTIKEAWTENTKGVLFVHLFGEPEDLSEIKELCDERGATLIEDCAQSYGSTAGQTGLASAYSFFPAKNLGCLGDGGAITTSDLDIAEKIKMIRAHGSKAKYRYEVLGGNFRMDTIQAGFLEVLLEHADLWIEKRRENAAHYNNHLDGIKGLTLPNDCKGHAWNQYTLRTERRDGLKAYLDKSKIGNAIYYPIPLHESRCISGPGSDYIAINESFESFDSSNSNANLVETEKRCKEVISIPVYPGLTAPEREVVVSKIKEFFDDT
jgi:dTDP-4-amino-4,6-dideoxygalactose transaminase